jgi:UDP-apiose/xylose synthase
VADVPASSLSTLDVSSEDFYGKGYDDSDRRIPDMTIITRQLGIVSLILLNL